MPLACPIVPTGPGFLGGLLHSMDCFTLSAAERSFTFLNASGGVANSILLTALTLLIVLFGYRLIFGPQPTFGDAAGTAVKIGVVLALATSWPAVSRVIAGPVINGPAELTGWLGSGPELPERLTRADEGIAAVASWGTGRNDIRSTRTANGDYAANAAATVSVSDAIALGGGKVSFLITAIGSIGLLHLLTGVLIGLAPIFAGALLFDRTRGLFAGWARALFALLIAGAAVRVLLALELSILEPWLATVIQQRQAFLATPSAPTELLAITLSFGLISAGMILLIFRTCLSLELPTARAVVTASPSEQTATGSTLVAAPSVRLVRESVQPDRALLTVGGMERLDSFRETSRLITSRSSSAISSVAAGSTPNTPVRTSAPRSGRRRVAMSQRRDARR